MSRHSELTAQNFQVNRATCEPLAGQELSTLEAGARALIERTLAAAGGNKRQAAKQLGISGTRLYATLARYQPGSDGTSHSK